MARRHKAPTRLRLLPFTHGRHATGSIPGRRLLGTPMAVRRRKVVRMADLRRKGLTATLRKGLTATLRKVLTAMLRPAPMGLTARRKAPRGHPRRSG